VNKIKVLVVDDAVVVRRIISNVLDDDPTLEVAGVAANGKIALDKIARLKPDIITLDIEMPVMDGLQTLIELRKLYPALPVIMFSTLTERGATATLDALALGANDYVTKPANVGSVVAAMQCLRDELVPKIKGLCGRPMAAAQQVVRPVQQPAAFKPAVQTRRPRKRERVDVVCIGISTGGPNALCTLIPQLPADLPVPVVIVQHMPPLFTKLLSQRLAEKSVIQVHEGAGGEKLAPGHVWLAPGGYHMVVSRSSAGPVVRLNQEAQENSCRPAVDVLFRSVVETYGPNVLGVVMTGMGQDGMLGCKRICETGGQVIVQDESSSVVWGMPGAVAKAGLADAIFPLDRIGAEIVKRVRNGRDSNRFAERNGPVHIKPEQSAAVRNEARL